MLACRPMLCFAVAVMLGVALARFHPGALGVLLPGWLVFLGLSLWFALTPRRPHAPPPSRTAALPHRSSFPTVTPRTFFPDPGG